MIKKIGTTLMICCFLIAALPNAALSAQPFSRQSLIKKNIAGLEDKLLADALDDSTPLHALTAQYLDDLRLVGFNKNKAALELATMQYVNDIKEQTTAAALDPACVPALLISITVNGSAMLQELTTGDTPVCETISLSKNAASIISAWGDYQICASVNSTDNATQKIADIKKIQAGLKVYSFTADVLSLGICAGTVTYQNFVNLLVEFIRLFM